MITQNRYYWLAVTLLLLISLGLTGCYTPRTYSGQGKTQKAEARFSEEQQARLLSAVPAPALDYSLERENLRERLIRFNDPNKISYIYLLSDYGQVITFLPIQGKVSSVNSLLSTGQQIVGDPYRRNRSGMVVESPQEDGSYGSNGDAIFFFTTEGTYMEWNGMYLLVDQPMQITAPPLMVYEASEEG